ncbi:hypothetical protein WJX82_001541 [Trebouxia sp. C0006]
MAATMCCKSWVWHTPHSRQPELPRLQHAVRRGSSFHGLAPPLRTRKQASGNSRRMSGQYSPGFDCRPGTTVIQLVYLTIAMPVLRVASLSRDDLPACLTWGHRGRAPVGAAAGRRAPKASSQAPLPGQPPIQRPATHAQTISLHLQQQLLIPMLERGLPKIGSLKTTRRAAEDSCKFKVRDALTALVHIYQGC